MTDTQRNGETQWTRGSAELSPGWAEFLVWPRLGAKPKAHPDIVGVEAATLALAKWCKANNVRIHGATPAMLAQVAAMAAVRAVDDEARR